MTDDEEFPLFGEKYRSDDNRKDNDTRFTVFSAEEQIIHYRKKAEWVRQWICNIIDYALADGDDFVIEWFHLWPSVLQDKLQERWDQVCYILLYKSDVWEIEYGLQAHSHPNDRAVKKTHQPETYTKIANFIYEFGQTLKKDAEDQNLQVVDMSQWNFKENIEKVVNLLIS